ncbi:hypothetical protein, partial [Vibrio navarrensis]|uniref:hypothetical protein n=1 Tax=Vibrio navarrensis TaxID=29495 RepID=UPI001D03FF96
MSVTLFTSVFCLAVTFFLIRSGNIKYNLLSPPILVNLFILLYVVLGFQAYWLGDYFFLGIDFTDQFEKIFHVSSFFSIIFTSSFFFFYYTRLSRSVDRNPQSYVLNKYLLLSYFFIFFSYALL